MRSANSVIITQKNKAENKPLFLYTIVDYDGQSNDLNYAASDNNITFPSSGGTVYTRFPISHDMITEGDGAKIDRVRLSLGNVSRLVEAYLHTYDLRNKKVIIKMVFRDQLDDAANALEDIFYIDEYSSGQKEAVFILSSRLDLLDLALPLRKYSRTHCQWAFKGTECGYTGSETSCNRTKQRCKQLNNFQRFGGFPSLKTGRTIIR